MHRNILMNLFASDRPGSSAGASPAAEPGSSPPPARAPHAGDLGLDDWAPRPTRSSSRRWLLVAAVVPWVVVAALLLGGDTSSPAPPAPTSAATAPTPHPTPTGAGRDTPAATVTTADPRPPRVTTTSSVTDRGRGVGLAVAVARSWLSTRPSGLALEGIPPSDGADQRYVEHLAVESVDHPAPGALVVTLRALVLPIDGDEYGEVAVRRLAVPVRLTPAGPQLGGPPWWLTSDEPAPAPPATEAVDDPDLQLAAVDAVTAAGYAEVELQELGRTDGWAWIAHLRARAPGARSEGSHTVWLRADVGRFVVAGTPAPGTQAELGSTDTADPPTPPSPAPTRQETS